MLNHLIFSASKSLTCVLPLSFSTNAALEIFALNLSSGDTEMPLKGTVASEHRQVNQTFNSP